MDRFLIILTILIGGCAAVPAPRPSTRPGATTVPCSPVRVVLLSKSLAPGMGPWMVEAHERFGEAVLVMAHGGMTLGQWCVAPDEGDSHYPIAIPVPVEWVIKYVKTEFPGRPIVLMSCNPGHCILHERGVFYATDDVWMIPDRFADPITRLARMNNENIGDIKQFVEGTP